MEENIGTGSGSVNRETNSVKDAASPKPNLEDFMTKSDGSLNVYNWVKLPEWDSFWARIFGTVYVFTKDNEILNTPHFDVYGSREDWDGIEQKGRYPLQVRFLKMQRVRLDKILIVLDQADVPKNRETASAKTAVQLAFMWMGKLLGDMGESNPYPESFNSANNQIEKRTDTAADNPQIELLEPMGGLGKVELIKALRAEVSHSINLFASLRKNSLFHFKNELMLYPSDMAAIKSLQESNFWLGQQLNNYRLEAEAQQSVNP